MVAETIRQWSKEGDGVVVHTPAYDAFYNTITANRRRIAPVPLILKDNRWRCDMDPPGGGAGGAKEYPAAAVQPAQPNGESLASRGAGDHGGPVSKHGVRVISDEIHMDMTWGEHRHIPWSEVAQGPWALFTSGSKSFNIPAFTGAYGFIPEENERDSYLQALKGRDGLSSLPCRRWSPISPPTATGLPWLDALRDYLQANMRYVADTLNNAFPRSAGGRRRPPPAWIDLRPLNVDDRALQQALIAEQKVAIMPGYTYGPEGNGFLRLNVGCPREKLERGVEGLIAALRSLS